MQSIVKNMWAVYKRMLLKKQLPKIYAEHNINFADIQNDFLLIDKLFANTGLNYYKFDEAFSLREPGAGIVIRHMMLSAFADSDIDSLQALFISYRKYKSSKFGKMIYDSSQDYLRIHFISYHSMIYYTIDLGKLEDGSGYVIGIVAQIMLPKKDQSYVDTLVKFSKGWLHGNQQTLIRQAIPYIEKIQDDKIKLEDDLIYLE